MTSPESFLVPKTKKAVKVCSMSEWDQPLQVQIANKVGVKQSPRPEIFFPIWWGFLSNKQILKNKSPNEDDYIAQPNVINF